MSLTNEQAVLALRKRRDTIDRALLVLKRKRSYRDSEKAMVAASYKMEQEAIDLAVIALQRQASGL